MTKPAMTVQDKRLAALEKARVARKNEPRPLTVAGIKKLWRATASRNNLTDKAAQRLLRIYINDVTARTRRAAVDCLGREKSRIDYKDFNSDTMTIYYRKPKRGSKKKAAAKAEEPQEEEPQEEEPQEEEPQEEVVE